MPKVTFEVDEQGNLTSSHIEGVIGPSCDAVSKIIKEVAGQPESEIETDEYRLRVRQAQQVRR